MQKIITLQRRQAIDAPNLADAYCLQAKCSTKKWASTAERKTQQEIERTNPKLQNKTRDRLVHHLVHPGSSGTQPVRIGFFFSVFALSNFPSHQERDVR